MGMFHSERVLVATTGAETPYLYDLGYLLSLPPGATFRFRYRAEWVSDEILRAASSSESLVGARLVLVFHSTKLKALLPVRSARIRTVELHGQFVFVRFSVDAFPVEHASDITEAEFLEGLSRTGAALVGHSDKLSERLPGKSHFRWSLMPPGAAWSELGAHERSNAWNNLVTIIQRDTTFKRVPLFHVLGFAELDSGRDTNRYVRYDDDTGEHILTAGKQYLLRTFERCDLDAKMGAMPWIPIDCDYDKSLLRLEGATNLVVGSYDVLEFTFEARSPGHSEIALKTSPEKAPSPKSPKDDQLPAASKTDPAAIAPAGRASHREDESWKVIYNARIPVRVRRNKAWIFFATVIALTSLQAYRSIGETTDLLAGTLRYLALLIAIGAVARAVELIIGSSKLADRNPITDSLRPPTG